MDTWRPLSLALLISLATAVAYPIPSAGQPVLPGLASGAASPKEQAGPTTGYSVEEIRKAQSDAKAKLEVIEAGGDAPADAPPATPPSEIAERLSLARQLASIHQQQLESLDRAAAARRSAADSEKAGEAWSGFDTPPPHSVLLLDSLRDELDAANEALTQAQARTALFERIDAGFAGKLRASQGAARLAIEAADRARGTPDHAALEWRRSLASLRATVDGATQDLLQLGLRAALADAEAARAKRDLARRKLTQAGAEFTLPRADLDRILADLDSRRRGAEQELERASRASAKAVDAVSVAERRLAAQRNSQPASAEARESQVKRTGELEREVASWKEVATTATQRAYLLREHLLQLDGEKAVWEARATALGERDPLRARAAYDRLTSSLSGVRTAKQYLEQQLAVVSSRMREEEVRQRAAGLSETVPAQRLMETLRARESDLRKAAEDSLRLDRLLSRFRADFEGRREVSLAERAKDAAAGAWLAGRRAWNYELFAIEDTFETAEGRRLAVARSVTVGKTFGAALIVLAGYWLSSLVVRRIERWVVARRWADPQSATLVRKWVLFVIAALLAVIALISASIPLTAFAFLGGALAIAAGFGLQNLLKNLVSGVMLLVERPLRLGDLVEVDGIRGRITEIGIRASTIRSVDGIESMIPNSRLVEGNVTNWTYTSPQTRQSITIGVGYGSPLRKVSELLADVLDRHGLVLKEPKPQVYLDEYADSAINFGLTYWVEMTADNDVRRVKSDLLHMIDRAFAESGIAIPFPQRDVHFNANVPVPVSIVQAAPPPAT